MPAGRPTKLNDELKAAARAYINGGWKDTIDVFPNAAGLAQEVGASKSSLYSWADSDPEFKEIMSSLNEGQERTVLAKGAAGDMTHVVTKLVLANHNYGEKAQLEHTGSGGGPLVIKWGSSDE